MLTRSHRQEGLSRAYVHTVASRCGLGASFREFDYKIDLSVHAIRQKGHRYVEAGFNLDIQAKSSTKAILTESAVIYDLDVKAMTTSETSMSDALVSSSYWSFQKTRRPGQSRAKRIYSCDNVPIGCLCVGWNLRLTPRPSE